MGGEVVEEGRCCVFRLSEKTELHEYKPLNHRGITALNTQHIGLSVRLGVVERSSGILFVQVPTDSLSSTQEKPGEPV